MWSQTILASALLSLTPSLTSALITPRAQKVCNNSPALCSKSYGSITQLGAHDSPFVRDSSNNFDVSGNQYFNSTVQLDAGVRLLTGQVHADSSSGSNQWRMCHSSCDLLDVGTLESWLSEIKTWMDANSNDVVTVLLVNSDSATATELEAQFSASGIDKYAYKPDSTTTVPSSWPTLNELITANTRLVSFVASLPSGSTSKYLLNEFDFVFENNYDVTAYADFNCDPNRPSTLTSTSEAASSGMLFLMNHFLYQDQLFGIQVPAEDNITTTNAQSGTGSLGKSITECTSTYGNAPWGVLVDFFNVGPAIASVDKANGVTNNTSGRKSVTTQVVTASTFTGAGAKDSSSALALVGAVAVAVFFAGA